MVTHDLFQAKRLADEILFINDGEIIEVSTKNKFLKSKNKLIQKFLKEVLSIKLSIAFYYLES